MVPVCGVILGSGLGPMSASARGRRSIPYERIPGFPRTGVKGHEGRISAGFVGETPVWFFEGRFHLYEGLDVSQVVFPVDLLAALGVRKLLLTTSAGAVNPKYRPGQIMLIRDHINLMGENPLFGKHFRSRGKPFVNLSRCYPSGPRSLAVRSARKTGLPQSQGVLAGVKGPVYETPAELRMLRSMGADAVCMSTVPEAIQSAFHGMETAGVCLITNARNAAAARRLSHEHVVRTAERALPKLTRFAEEFLARWGGGEKS
jgi:purine-nucleoside phosphorylase